ncbi:MAG: hypothetical protein ACRC0X_00490 [Brevinema sp.]
MKLLLLQIKLFFARKEIKLFFTVFFVSFPIILFASYIAFPYLVYILEQEDRAKYYEGLYEIINMPRTTNYNVIVEDTVLTPPNIDNIEQNFWMGDALDYRYTVPKHGVPK